MTIYALSTPLGRSAVAVIRVSGEECRNILKSLVGKVLEPRTAVLTKIKDPSNGETIDDALTIYFKAPASFTGEDVIEFHTHGSRAVIKELLSVLGGLTNVRPAEPGEFTKRAFYNNKFDLTEAEGIADLINAQTKHQKKQALRQLEGENSKVYENWREVMLKTLAHLEAYIDFPEEDIPETAVKDLENKVNKLKSEINANLADDKGEVIREGISVAIIGQTNAGKSSLLNHLAGSETAIVSEIEGTTRDVVEVNIDLDGYLVSIADTAGLRESECEIEQEGIKRSYKKAEYADIRIAMFDITKPLDEKTFNLIDEDTIVVFNKADKTADKNSPELKEKNNIPVIASIKQKQGLDKIIEQLKDKISGYGESNHIITCQRHRHHLNECVDHLSKIDISMPIEIVCEELRFAAVAIGKITGRIDIEEILDEIFSNFCIGK